MLSYIYSLPPRQMIYLFFRYIYALPLRQIIALMLITVPMWSFGQLRRGWGLRSWRAVNGLLAALSVALILFMTLFHRSSEDSQVILTPFYSFVLAQRNPELYREMLMNVLLFFPLGLSLSSALPDRLSVGRRFACTVLAALLLSLTVELCQMIFSLGLSETDDLLTNTFGAALGASQLPLSRLLWKLKR